jgi:hypothetical protein
MARMACGGADSHSTGKGLLDVRGDGDHRFGPKGLTTLTHRLLFCWLGLGDWSVIDTRLPPGSF